VVTVLEQQEAVGGNAGSFELAGQFVDYGSHRLHSACDPAILEDIKRFLGDDLADRPRHGRIRLRGRWLHFPLKPLDLLLELDYEFGFGAFRDMVARTLRARPPDGETFASVLRANLGPTICEHFYFPYARKIWGRAPEELSGIQAFKRVSAGSFGKLMRRLLRPPGAGRFYYPRRGYGQISEAYADAARRAGADILLGWRVSSLRRPGRAGDRWTVEACRNGETRVLEADHVWSTIPIPVAIRMMMPAAPPDVLQAGKAIDYRAMILVYLVLDVDQFTTTDAHYFPEESVCFTRLSEPKNYFGRSEPKGTTVLCAELPCASGDAWWNMADASLGELVVEHMRRCDLPISRPPVGIHVRRLRQAYPIYPLGYEKPLGVLEGWLEELPGFLSYGRQGLFAHDNTHHALYMAYCAVDCLDHGHFDAHKWAEYRQLFATHVVED
jgi:protoporphyrinogen oxidase